jgi:predicted MPP superfamily phosphohydrolase
VHEAIDHLRPDIIVFTGDAIDDPTRLQDLADFMALLPDVPRVGVLGNWEYWSDADLQELKSIYERRSGSRLLVNEVADYDFNGKKLRMLGLDDFTAGQPSQPWQSPKLSADASIVLEHSPGLFDSKDTINRILQDRHDLCLSGHTHSGQVTLFGLALWTPRGSGHFKAGFYDTDHCRLYVSRGIGTSILHLRFGARPELAVFDL